MQTNMPDDQRARRIEMLKEYVKDDQPEMVKLSIHELERQACLRGIEIGVAQEKKRMRALLGLEESK